MDEGTRGRRGERRREREWRKRKGGAASNGSLIRTVLSGSMRGVREEVGSKVTGVYRPCRASWGGFTSRQGGQTRAAEQERRREREGQKRKGAGRGRGRRQRCCVSMENK
eukprot:3019417-Rhodomonas_salina.1